jgi:protocatechuate 3,4-dioxygenase beta subunit
VPINFSHNQIRMKRKLTRKTLLTSTLKRRKVLGFIAGTTGVSLMGCLRSQSATIEPIAPLTQAQATSANPTPACVVRPQQTEGPYFRDEKLNRSDIRSDPSDGSLKPGTPLKLTFRVSQVKGAACSPLNAAIVDVWHCDAGGSYSDVSDRSFDTVGQKFLRGYQVTNADGIAEFTTIYPGWYPGRTVHIHFKVRAGDVPQSSYEFTSQLYFDDTLTDQVYTQAPYAAKGQRNQKNNQDPIFQNGGEQLTLQLAQTADGYAGTFEIGLETA